MPTDSDKSHARDMLSTAQGPDGYEAVIQQLQREVNIAHNSARGARAAERAGTGANPIADPTQQGGSVPAGAAAALRANPSLRSQFDAKYGAGASAGVLGQ